MAMSIKEFVSDAGRMKGYGDWLANSMTRELLELAKEHVCAGPLKQVSGENALYQYGIVEGATLILTLLSRMDELVRQQEIADLMSEQPTYGAERIVKEKYI